MENNSFNYLGLTFVPYRQLAKKEDTFEAISRRIKHINITPKGWNYDEFYETAKRASESNATIDIFKCNGYIVIPATNYIFEYV
jgi:hypothetical protein